MVIYKITNNLNGKIYIGQTTQDLFRRFCQHCSAKTIIGSAIRKYGKENFTIELISEVSTLQELNTKEEELIKKFNSLAPSGYNAAYGGDNRRQTKESRYKLSMAQLGRKHTEETKRKLSVARRKRITTEQTKEKMRNSAKRGQENTNSKITESDALNIKNLLSKSMTAKEIAKQLDVSIHIVYDIKNGKTWKHLN